MGGSKKGSLGLIALDIEGEWNVPLLENAAELSNATLEHAVGGREIQMAVKDCSAFAEISRGFDTILACETGRKAENIFRFPVPRGKVALVVGNEKMGIPKSVLKQCDATVTIPMFCNALSSINVAASSAVALYAVSRDLARQKLPRHRGKPALPDLLMQAPEDPSECGSALRSVAAFGWKHIYLADPHQAWFTRDNDSIAASRAAARREVNPLVVRDISQFSPGPYQKIIMCKTDKRGVPLSRYRWDAMPGSLVVYGLDALPAPLTFLPRDELYVDFVNGKSTPRSRFEISTLLAVLAHQIAGAHL